VVDAVDTQLRRYPSSPVLQELLGTADADAIRALVEEWAGAPVDIFFVAVSVGAVFGVCFSDGTRAALKVHAEHVHPRYLDDVQALQAHLADAGFPAPRPLGRRGRATLDEWRDEGRFRDAHEPPVRQAMAATLARLVGLATASGIRPRGGSLPAAVDGLWPRPHNALFDFAATAHGAERIDEIAAAAKPLRDVPGAEAVGLPDFAAKHVRFDEDLHPTAVYDWDVKTEAEHSIVGTAAASYLYTEELDRPVELWPTADETLAFLDDYEAARGAPFAPAERRAAQAAAVYMAAYAARCLHALGQPPADLPRFAERLL
jgi:hypothetical protein